MFSVRITLTANFFLFKEENVDIKIRLSVCTWRRAKTSIVKISKFKITNKVLKCLFLLRKRKKRLTVFYRSQDRLSSLKFRVFNNINVKLEKVIKLSKIIKKKFNVLI